MGTWSNFPDALDWAQDRYEHALSIANIASTQLNNAWVHWNAGNDHLALQDAMYAISSVIWGIRYDSTAHSDLTDNFAAVWCLNYLYNLPSAEEFTMDLLLSTMLGADPEQVTYFIGLVDAYRQSIWNKPFNREYFAALARGFMIWE